MCLRTRGGVAIRRYVTEVSYVVPTEKDDENVHDKEWELTGDGRLSCRFSRDMKVKTDSVDLNNNWYQLYAWGAVSQCQYYVLSSSQWRRRLFVSGKQWRTQSGSLGFRPH